MAQRAETAIKQIVDRGLSIVLTKRGDDYIARVTTQRTQIEGKSPELATRHLLDHLRKQEVIENRRQQQAS